jgi:hypothetical protein
VRYIALFVLTLVLAACGSSVEQTGAPSSSGQESVPADTSELAQPEANLKPPPILLLSEVGKQKAVYGSYCVDFVDEATGQGQGVCSDAAGSPIPARITSIAAGDGVTFVLEDAVARAGKVTIRPLGCDDQRTAELEFEPGTGRLEWDVDLDPGAYQLDVFAPFEAKDGRTGDVSGTLGLTVAGAKKWDALGVSGVRRSMQVCPFPD